MALLSIVIEEDVMRILDRYIGMTVASSTMMVMLVLVALFSFFTFAGELSKTGKGAYDSFQAIQYALATAPGMLYQLFPASALIGTMMGLGILANSSELIAMRAAGYSLVSLLRSVMYFGLFLMLSVFMVGEYLAPVSQEYAETKRSIAMSGKNALQTDSGLWIRDGLKFVRIENIDKSGRWSNVRVFELSGNQKIETIITADRASHVTGDKWILDNFEQRRLDDEGVHFEDKDRSVWATALSPEILDVVSIKPEMMSATDALDYVNYLNDNGVDARKYLQAFWLKIVTPFSTAVMVLLAIPFIFGPMRTQSAGHRILIGTLTGIGFYLFAQVFSYVGLVFELNPFLAATFPTFIFLAIALLLMRRVQ